MATVSAAPADGQSARGPAAERRDDPRRGQSPVGPVTPPAESRTADADQIQAGAAATPPPASAPILHRHALESVFTFLILRDLAAALVVSRDWLGAVGSMRRLAVALRIRGPQSWALSAVSHSAMGRHIGELSSVHLVGEEFFPVVDQLAHLRALRCTLSLPLADWPVRFPAQLRLLDVHLLGYVGPVNLNAAIAAIAQLPLIEELTVRLPVMDPQISFGPLTALPLLRRLRFVWARHQDELSDAQIDELREMPRLHQVEMAMTKAQLRRLLRQPHDLQWQQIPLPYPLDDEFAALLLLLPSLTVLGSSPTCSNLEWLRGLPNLTDVDLVFSQREDVADRAAALVPGLQHCTNIEVLALSGSTVLLEFSGCHDLTAAHLAELLPRLPRLRELRLIHLSIDSLAFLAQPVLASQLRSPLLMLLAVTVMAVDQIEITG